MYYAFICLFIILSIYYLFVIQSNFNEIKSITYSSFSNINNLNTLSLTNVNAITIISSPDNEKKIDLCPLVPPKLGTYFIYYFIIILLFFKLLFILKLHQTHFPTIQNVLQSVNKQT